MKYLLKNAFLAFVIFIASCEAKRTVEECLDKPNKRAAIYEQILTNSKYAHEFTHVMMMADRHEIHMDSDTAFKKGMMTAGNLVMICARDSVMCDTVAKRLMQNNLFMKNMIERMYLKGAMDERCVSQAYRALEIPVRPQIQYEGMGDGSRR